MLEYGEWLSPHPSLSSHILFLSLFHHLGYWIYVCTTLWMKVLFSFLIIYLYLLLVCVRLASMIDRSEWMYGLDRVNDPRYLDEVRKFITVAKRHRERLKQIATICACSLSLSICPCIRIRTSSIQLMPRDDLYLQDDGPCKQTMRPWYSLSLSIAC